MGRNKRAAVSDVFQKRFATLAKWKVSQSCCFLRMEQSRMATICTAARMARSTGKSHELIEKGD